MKAVRSTEDGIRVVDVPDPEPDGADCVVVEMAAVGICGSDFGYVRAGSRFTLGHELAGTTPDGTAVAVEGVFGCGTCAECRAGTYNRCATVGMRVPGLSMDGGMAERMAVPAASLVALPAGLALRDAALVEPAAVACHAVRLGGVGPGSRVGVVGGGALGLLVVAAARSAGAEVGLVARHPHQRAAGRRLGARAAADGGGGPAAGQAFDGPACDVVVEAAGTPDSLQRAVELVRPGGTVVCTGIFASETLPVPFLSALMKEVTVVPSMAYCRHAGGRDVDDAAALLAAGPDIADALVTHRFGLDEAAEAFRVAADRASGAIKVVVEL